MYSFLFNAQHPYFENDAFFGPPCTSRVVAAFEKVAPTQTTRLIRGKVIPEQLCFGLGGFTVGASAGDHFAQPLEPDPEGELMSLRHVTISVETGRADEVLLSPDADRFRMVVCDLAETLCEPPGNVNEQMLLALLRTGCVWAVSIACESDGQALEIDRELRAFEPYLGMSKLDLGNMVQRSVMVELMLSDDVVVSPTGLTYRVEPGLDEEDVADRLSVATALGSSRGTYLADYEEFESFLPPLSYPAQPSKRGVLSESRLAGKMKTSHKERVGAALLEVFKSRDTGEQVTFSTAREAGVSEFFFPPEKFTDYLLNLAHPVGGGKAKFFVDELGIAPRDWQFLASQIEQGMAAAPIYRAGQNAQGFTHGAYVLVEGRNGKTVALETGWILEHGKPARFVTAYPASRDAAGVLQPAQPLVVEPDLVGDLRWSSIYSKADLAGRSAAESAAPTPVVIEGLGTQWDGNCGSAYVVLADAQHEMAKWLVDQGTGLPASPGVRISSRIASRSLDRQLAYAEAFAAVMRANAIECTIYSALN